MMTTYVCSMCKGDVPFIPCRLMVEDDALEPLHCPYGGTSEWWEEENAEDDRD